MATTKAKAHTSQPPIDNAYVSLGCEKFSEEVITAAATRYDETVVNQTPPVPSDSILDLPDDVKANIVGYEDMALDEMITGVLSRYMRGTTCDRIIQQLWTQYRQNPLRAKVMQRLRGLIRFGNIEKVEGMRSMYRLVRAIEQGATPSIAAANIES